MIGKFNVVGPRFYNPLDLINQYMQKERVELFQ